MTQPEPRYEFRVFEAELKMSAERLRSVGVYRARRESAEIYLVGDSEDYNCKIRDDRLEIKERLAVEQGLERWCPRLKAAFPLDAKLLEDELYPALALAGNQPLWKRYDLTALFEDLSGIEPKIKVAQVQKQRTNYQLGGCQAEYVKLRIEQTMLESIAVESIDAAQVLAALALLGLDRQSNTSYPQAIANINWQDKRSVSIV